MERPVLTSIAVLGGWLVLAASAALPAAEWKTGPALARELAAPVGINWASNPLRRAIGGLAAAKEVAIFLDRRLDPDKKIDFTIANVPLEEALDNLADRQEWGVSSLGPVLYLGPRATTKRLATYAAQRLDQAAALPPAARRGLVANAPLAWAELDTPREIAERIAQTAGVKLFNPERIPHDLWPAASLPPMTAIDKLTLVLAGFDLAVEISPDGSAVRPVPLPEHVSVTRTFPAGANAASVLKQLDGKLPDLRLKVEGNNLIAEGRVEELNAIGKLLRGETVKTPRPPPGKAKQIYTLQIDNKPIGSILPALGKQLGLEVEFDPALENQLGKVVSFKVKDASLEELLTAAVSSAGFRYELHGMKLKVLAK